MWRKDPTIPPISLASHPTWWTCFPVSLLVSPHAWHHLSPEVRMGAPPYPQVCLLLFTGPHFQLTSLVPLLLISVILFWRFNDFPFYFAQAPFKSLASIFFRALFPVYLPSCLTLTSHLPNSVSLSILSQCLFSTLILVHECSHRLLCRH